MAIQFSTSIDGMFKNSLLNWLFQTSASDIVASSSADPGLFYFNNSATYNGGRGGLRIRGNGAGASLWWTVPFGEVGVLSGPIPPATPSSPATAPDDANRNVSTYDGLAPVRGNYNRINARADWAIRLDVAQNFSISGKATAAAVSFRGDNAVVLNVTALSVVPSDITLAQGSMITGDATGKGTAIARTSIPISNWGPATGIIDMGNNRITNMADPINLKDAVTLGYLQANSAGLNPQPAVGLATAAMLPQYNVLTPGVLEAKVVGKLTIDGVDITAADITAGTRILVKDEPAAYYYGSDAIWNGIYTVTVVGDAGTKWRLTRATDADTTPELQPGYSYFVTGGTTMKNTGWVQSSPKPFVLNVDDCLWNQYAGGSSLVEGHGIRIVGTTIHFATAGNYTAGTVPFASGATTIAFSGQAASAGYPFIARSTDGSTGPTFDRLDFDLHNNGGTPSVPIEGPLSPVKGILSVVFGGTGNSSLNQYHVLLGNAGGPIQVATPDVKGYVLISEGPAAFPKFQQLRLGSTGGYDSLTGILPVTHGGTGRDGSTGLELTAGGVLYGQTSSSPLGITNAPGQNTMLAETSGVPGFLAVAGDLTLVTNGTATFTINSHAVTYPKMQQVTGLSLLGNDSTTLADVKEITPGAPLPNKLPMINAAGTAIIWSLLGAGNFSTGQVLKMVETDIPQNTTTFGPFDHGLKGTDVNVQVMRKEAPFDTILCDVERDASGTGRITLRFNPPVPSGKTYRAIIIGKQL